MTSATTTTTTTTTTTATTITSSQYPVEAQTTTMMMDEFLSDKPPPVAEATSRCRNSAGSGSVGEEEEDGTHGRDGKLTPHEMREHLHNSARQLLMMDGDSSDDSSADNNKNVSGALFTVPTKTTTTRTTTTTTSAPLHHHRAQVSDAVKPTTTTTTTTSSLESNDSFAPAPSPTNIKKLGGNTTTTTTKTPCVYHEDFESEAQLQQQQQQQPGLYNNTRTLAEYLYEEPLPPPSAVLHEMMTSPRTSSLRDSMILRLTRVDSAGGTTMTHDDANDADEQDNDSLAHIDAMFAANGRRHSAEEPPHRVIQALPAGENDAARTTSTTTSVEKKVNLLIMAQEEELRLVQQEEDVLDDVSTVPLRGSISSIHYYENSTFTNAELRAEEQRRADRALKDSGTTLSPLLLNQQVDVVPKDAGAEEQVVQQAQRDADSDELKKNTIARSSSSPNEDSNEEARRQLVSHAVAVRLPPPIEASYRTLENIRKSGAGGCGGGETSGSQGATISHLNANAAAAAAASIATHCSSSEDDPGMTNQQPPHDSGGGGVSVSTHSSVTNSLQGQQSQNTRTSADGPESYAATGSRSSMEDDQDQQDDVHNRAISMTGAIRVRGVNYRYTHDNTRPYYDSSSDHPDGGGPSEAFSLSDWVDPHPNVDDDGNEGLLVVPADPRNLPIQAHAVETSEEDHEAAKREIQERVEALERQLCSAINPIAYFTRGACGGGGSQLIPISSAVISATSVQSICDDDDDDNDDLDVSGRSSTGSRGRRSRVNSYHGGDDGGKHADHAAERCSIWWWPAGLCFLLFSVVAIIVAVALTPGDEDNSSEPMIMMPPASPPNDSSTSTSTTTTTTIGGMADDDAPTASAGDDNNKLPARTLDIIQERGYIRCRAASYERQQGFGFGMDLCRALSAAIFDGDGNRTEFPDIPWGDHWALIASGEIDVSTSEVTFTMERDVLQPNARAGLAFSSPYIYTGTIFAGLPEMVGCAEAGETLLGACSTLRICVVKGTTTEVVVRSHLQGSAIRVVADSTILPASLISGDCNVLSGEPSILYEQKVRDLGYEGEYVFGSELFSKEPLAMVTRGDDPEFADLSEWVLQSLVTAEAMNITQADAEAFPSTDVFGPKYSRMFANAVAAVGNYGEMYELHIEQRFPRSGMNFINQGDTGLLYALPFGNLELDDPSSAVKQQRGGTLESINNRSIVVCGVLSVRPWLGINDGASFFDGLDVEFCRALSAAKFTGDTNRLAIVKYDTAAKAFEALEKKIIDVLASVPHTLENDVTSTGVGFSLSPPYFYDPNADTAFSMATRQDDQQWSDFVRWTIYSTIYAEEQGISSENAADLPTVDLFGPAHVQMFRFINLALGNYGDMYARTEEERSPRSGRNLLSSGGPQLIARPSDFGFEEGQQL